MKVEFLAHRGLWKEPSQKNSPEALQLGLEAGYGLETDIRDCLGKLVISHDLPTGNEQTLESLLAAYRNLNSQAALAINIKADGLAGELKKLLINYGIENYFCFDMSVPDSRSYGPLGMPVFARRSEFEPHSRLTTAAPGIWLDGFESTWFDSSEWYSWLKLGKSVCIVSPELHRRPHLELWGEIKNWIADIDSVKAESPGTTLGRLLLCTDYPKELEAFLCQ